MGSSPTASAETDWGHGPTGRRQHRTLEIRVRLPVTPLNEQRYSPVVQRQDVWPTSRKRWFNSIRDHLRPGTPTGRAAWLKPRRLQVRLLPWARPGRQPEDHLGLEPAMLRVRVPPGPLTTDTLLVEQPGVLACLSRKVAPGFLLGKPGFFVSCCNLFCLSLD